MNFLKFLTDGRVFLSMFILSFAEGAVALGGGDGAAAAVIAGVTGEEGGEAEGAEHVEGAEGVANADEGGQGEGVLEVEAEKPIVAAPQIDGRQVPAAIRKHLADLKATNPQMAKELNDYVWGYKNLKADIAKNFGPEGLKEAIALKATVEELAGADSVEQFREEVQDYRTLDQQFINGDPEFIKTAVAKFPEGFKKLAPSMLDTWSQIDPEGYDRRMAGIIVATLNQNQFGNNLARAVDFLEMKDPDKSDPVIQKVMALLGEGQKALTGWATFASSKPKAPEVDPRAAENAKATAELEEKQTKFFIQGVAREFDGFSDTKISGALTAIKAKPLNPEARKVFDNLVRKDIAKQLEAQPNFTQKYGALIANRDHAGAMKLLQSRADSLFHDAVNKTYKYLYGEAKLGAKKPAVAAAGKPGAPPQKPAAGWVKFNPPADLIDRKATAERDIVFAKKAILKDGRRVYWGDKIPT